MFPGPTDCFWIRENVFFVCVLMSSESQPISGNFTPICAHGTTHNNLNHQPIIQVYPGQESRVRDSKSWRSRRRGEEEEEWLWAGDEAPKFVQWLQRLLASIPQWCAVWLLCPASASFLGHYACAKFAPIARYQFHVGADIWDFCDTIRCVNGGDCHDEQELKMVPKMPFHFIREENKSESRL